MSFAAFEYVDERDGDEAMRLAAVDRERRRRARRVCPACRIPGGHVFNCPEGEDDPEPAQEYC